MKPAFIYIISNRDGKLYIGSTDNLERRLREHLAGKTQTTRNMGVINLVFQQKFENLLTARRIEIKLKRLKRKDYIEKIIQDGYIKTKI